MSAGWGRSRARRPKLHLSSKDDDRISACGLAAERIVGANDLDRVTCKRCLRAQAVHSVLARLIASEDWGAR